MKAIHITRSIAVISIFFLASCSTEQAVFSSSDQLAERIDMVINGDKLESIYLENSDTDQNLLDYNFYGVGANKFDIHLNLDARRTLIIKMVNESVTDLWSHEGGYSIFASRDLDDKQKFVTVELTNGSEVASYKSNIGDVFPQGTTINVFNIIDFNPANNEIFARITDMPMMSTTSGEILTINGTFRGAVDTMN